MPEKEVIYKRPLKGVIGRRLEVINGQEVWVKICLPKTAKGCPRNYTKKRK